MIIRSSANLTVGSNISSARGSSSDHWSVAPALFTAGCLLASDCCDWYGVNGDCGDCSCLAGTHDGADVRIVAGRKVLTPSTCRSRLPRCYRPAPNGPSGLLLSDLAVWDGHVAMVVGNGMIIEAGDPVRPPGPNGQRRTRFSGILAAYGMSVSRLAQWAFYRRQNRRLGLQGRWPLSGEKAVGGGYDLGSGGQNLGLNGGLVRPDRRFPSALVELEHLDQFARVSAFARQAP